MHLTLYVLGTNLNLEQMNTGRIAMFNMWDYAMTEEQIQNLGCADKGNLVNFDTLQRSSDPGNIQFEEITLNKTLGKGRFWVHTTQY